jgi:pantothenate kinase-related protein Tda10
MFYTPCYVQFIYKFKKQIKMEKKDLIITVSGQVASGKSHLTYLLKKFLREQGFEVKFDGNLDHPTESNFDKHMSKNFDEVIENFKDTRKITLKEVQLARNWTKD